MRVLGAARLVALLGLGLVASCSLNAAGEGDGGADRGDGDGPEPDRPDRVDGDVEAEDRGELDDGRRPEDGTREDGDGTDVPFCGNGVADEGEACDGTDLRDVTCESLGRLPGELLCTADCMLDLSGCPPPDTCGNGVAETGEICDNDDLRGSDCLALGYAGGALACTPVCTLDVTECVPACTDACPAEGARECGGTRIRACLVGAAGCREWNDEVDCASTGQVCDTATGTPACLGGTGESCADPLVLGTLPYNDSGGDITAAFANDQDFRGMHCDTASGVEAVSVRFLAAGESIRIRETGTMDAVLRVLATCSDVAECLASRGDPEDPGLTFTAPSDGNYYFVVEAYHAIPASKGFNLTIEESPGGDLCTDPLVADPLPLNVHGGDFRTRFTDDVRFSSSTCQPADGREAFLARALRAGETVRLRETGTLDAVLHVRDSCDPAAPCLLSRDAPETPGLTFTAPADGTYFFVVETRLALPSSVGYDITLDDPPPGNLCTDPLVVTVPVTVSGRDFEAEWTDDMDFVGRNCTTASGAELVLALDATAGETIQIDERGGLDVVIRVLTSCERTAECLYSQDLPENPGVNFVAPADGRYDVVLEGLLAFPGVRDYEVVLSHP